MPFCELVIDLKFTTIVRSLHPLSLVQGIVHFAQVLDALCSKTWPQHTAKSPYQFKYDRNISVINAFPLSKQYSAFFFPVMLILLGFSETGYTQSLISKSKYWVPLNTFPLIFFFVCFEVSNHFLQVECLFYSEIQCNANLYLTWSPQIVK